MTTTEVWRPIEGFEGYQVSNLGNVKSNKTGLDIVMHPSKDSDGYMVVSLSPNKGKYKTMKVHRLVAMAFIPNPYGKPHINHIDYNRSNNVINNLEWVTPKENTAHSICHFPKDKPTPYNNPTHERFIILNKNSGSFRVKIKGKYYGSYKTIEEAVAVRDKLLKEYEEHTSR